MDAATSVTAFDYKDILIVLREKLAILPLWVPNWMLFDTVKEVKEGYQRAQQFHPDLRAAAFQPQAVQPQ